jgi:hypothetical protein
VIFLHRPVPEVWQLLPEAGSSRLPFHEKRIIFLAHLPLPAIFFLTRDRCRGLQCSRLSQDIPVVCNPTALWYFGFGSSAGNFNCVVARCVRMVFAPIAQQSHRVHSPRLHSFGAVFWVSVLWCCSVDIMSLAVAA